MWYLIIINHHVLGHFGDPKLYLLEYLLQEPFSCSISSFSPYILQLSASTTFEREHSPRKESAFKSMSFLLVHNLIVETFCC